MTIEQEIIELRLIESQAKINGYSDQFAADLVKRYSAAVDLLSERIEFTDQQKVDEVISELSVRLSIPVSEAFGVAGEASAVNTASVLSWDGAVKDFKPVTLSANQLAGLALTKKINGKSLVDHLTDGIGQEVLSGIQRGRLEGKGIKEMSRGIWKDLDGAVSRRNIETVSRTYTATASSYTRELTYKQNSDIIKGYRLSATLENGNVRLGTGTCPRCSAMDQQVWKKDEVRPMTPFHPNCRCLYTPETLSWKELGFDIPEMKNKYRPWTERARSGRKEEFGTTDLGYDDFWRSKSKDWQDKQVGTKRAEMIRGGLIGYNDIVDRRTSKLYTIEELIKKHNLKERV